MSRPGTHAYHDHRYDDPGLPPGRPGHAGRPDNPRAGAPLPLRYRRSPLPGEANSRHLFCAPAESPAKRRHEGTAATIETIRSDRPAVCAHRSRLLCQRISVEDQLPESSLGGAARGHGSAQARPPGLRTRRSISTAPTIRSVRLLLLSPSSIVPFARASAQSAPTLSGRC